MNTVEKRRNFIIDTVYFALLVGLFYLFMKYAFGICFPFILAVFVAVLLQKPVNWFTKKLHGGRGIISALLVLFCFIVLGSVIILLLSKLFSEVKGLFDYLLIKLENAPLFIEQVQDWIETKLTILPSNIRDTVSNYAGDLLGGVLGTAPEAVPEKAAAVETPSTDWSWLASPLSAVWGTAKQIPMIAVGVIVAIVSCCFMTSDYRTLCDMVLTQAGEKNAVKLLKTKRILFSTLGKMGKAYAILIGITFTEMLIGLSFLKLIGVYEGGYLFAISLVTAIVDILPVLGTGTILVPWGIWSLLTGNIGFGIGILVLYAIITVIRQIIEPKLVAAQLGLPPFITIMAMYIGTQLFGFIGLMLMPITVMLIKVLNDEGIINILKRKPVDVQTVSAEVELELSQQENDKKPDTASDKPKKMKRNSKRDNQ